MILDAGLRVNSVYQAHRNDGNWQRELVGQAVGLGMSVWIGGVAFSLLLGPAGVIIALIFAGAAAVGMDYLGRAAGYQIYDTGAWLSKSLQPPFVY